MAIESTSITNKVPPKKQKRKIPAFLLKETIDGIPFYYKGYKSVLNNSKKLEDIMPDSGLQAFIKRYLFLLLVRQLDESKFEVLMGEVGNHLAHRSNMGLDIAVYDTALLTPDKITTKYIDVIPKIVIEVDVNVEMEEKKVNLFEEFVLRKVRALHKAGTEKIIWVLTKSKTVIVANADNNWQVLSWDAEVELLEGISCNIAKYLIDKGIN